jgi:hypothetical protein
MRHILTVRLISAVTVLLPCPRFTCDVWEAVDNPSRLSRQSGHSQQLPKRHATVNLSHDLHPLATYSSVNSITGL